LKTEVNAALIEQKAPDIVIVATGGRYSLPEIQGIEHSIIVDVAALSKQAELPLTLFGSAWLSKLSHIALPGIGKKVVIIGGQIEGLQGAVFLKKRGREVTVLEASDSIGKGMPMRYLNRALPWLDRKGVQIFKEVKYEEITPKGIKVSYSGNSHFFEADTIMVLMVEKDPDHRLMMELKDKVPEVYTIGSSNGDGSGLIVHALEEGRRIACSI